MLEHDELDWLLNGIDWDQPLSPLDLKLPRDPDIISLLSFSSPISRIALLDQPPNQLVEKFLQSLTNAPIQSTDHPATSRQESRVNILLPSLFGSKVYSNKTQSEESQTNPSFSKQLASNLTAPGTLTQDARASLSRPNQLQRNQQIGKQKRKERRYRHNKSVRRPRNDPSLHYQLTNAFISWEIVFWDHRRQEYTIQNTVLSSQRIVVPLTFFEVQPRRKTLNPQAPIFKPKNRSRLFSIYRLELLTEMDARTSQDVIDLTISAKSPKPSSDSKNPTVSEQLHLLTTQVNQPRINSEQALEQTKPLIQTFPLANIKQFQYLHAVQHHVAWFFVHLKSEKSERPKPRATTCQFEDELAQLRRQITEPSPSSLPACFTVDPKSSAAFQDHIALDNIQITRPRLTITFKRTSSSTSQSRLAALSRAPSSTQTTSGPSSDLETRVKELEEEFTKARDSREKIASIHRSQFTFLYDKIRALESVGTGTILWKLTAVRLIFDTAKSAA